MTIRTSNRIWFATLLGVALFALAWIGIPTWKLVKIDRLYQPIMAMQNPHVAYLPGPGMIRPRLLTDGVPAAIGLFVSAVGAALFLRPHPMRRGYWRAAAVFTLACLLALAVSWGYWYFWMTRGFTTASWVYLGSIRGFWNLLTSNLAGIELRAGPMRQPNISDLIIYPLLPLLTSALPVLACLLIQTRQKGHCPECGYNLHGLTDAKRCPECGHSVPELNRIPEGD